MKKFIIGCSLLFLTGCGLSKSLQVNAFADLWNKLVTEKNTSVVINKFDDSITRSSERKFAKLNKEMDDLRNFLILGEMTNDLGEKELVFRDGLMKIADENNEKLINQLKESVDIIDGNGLFKQSLSKEIKKMKKRINKICLRQKVSIDCDL